MKRSSFHTQFDTMGSLTGGLWLHCGSEAKLRAWRRPGFFRSLPRQRVAAQYRAEKPKGWTLSRKLCWRMFWICLKAQESDWKAVWHLLCCLLSEAECHDGHFHYEWSHFFQWFIPSQQPDPAAARSHYYSRHSPRSSSLQVSSPLPFLCSELICSTLLLRTLNVALMLGTKDGGRETEGDG